MRKNCQQAVRAFDNARAARPAEAIWTDGQTVFSYRTAILTVFVVEGEEGRSEEVYVLNRTSYSVTTTVHQNALAAEYRGVDTLVTVDGLPTGCSRQDLIDAARAMVEG